MWKKWFLPRLKEATPFTVVASVVSITPQTTENLRAQLNYGFQELWAVRAKGGKRVEDCYALNNQSKCAKKDEVEQILHKTLELQSHVRVTNVLLYGLEGSTKDIRISMSVILQAVIKKGDEPKPTQREPT
ncbi:unnamed protein product [Linum trigynum]|uniref:Uncharacterized protein n=1 Tax=Linum trigynum TaxID=586398 RepID=A0AAV2FB80_9ROSI